MITIVKGKLIDIFTQDWEMEGKKGTTNKLCVYTGNGKFENVAVSKDEALNFNVGEDVELHCNCYIKKNGSYNLKVVA